jgi:hypothetical protein
MPVASEAVLKHALKSLFGKVEVEMILYELIRCHHLA